MIFIAQLGIASGSVGRMITHEFQRGVHCEFVGTACSMTRDRELWVKGEDIIEIHEVQSKLRLIRRRGRRRRRIEPLEHPRIRLQISRVSIYTNATRPRTR